MVQRTRRRMRKIGSSSSGGLPDSTKTYGAVGDEDEDEDLDLNAIVMQEAENNQQADNEVSFNPDDNVGKSSDVTGYGREHRLRLLHRMLMRSIPLDQIAAELDISVRTVMRDRTELYRRLKNEASNLDLNNLIGDTMGFYSDVVGMSLRVASNKKTPMNIRLAAMRTALSSKNDQNRFLNAAGVFDTLVFKSGSDKGNNDIAKLMEMTQQIMQGDIDSFDKDSLPVLDTDEEELEIRMF